MRHCVFPILIAVCVLWACNRTPVKRGSKVDNVTGIATPAPVMAFQRYTLLDPASRTQALSLLLPDGWTVQSDARWVEADASAPFKYRIAAVDTVDSLSRIDFYPTLAFITSSSKTVEAGPVSDLLIPSHRPILPQTVTDAIRTIVIPMHRPSLQDVRVIEKTPLAVVPQMENAVQGAREFGLVRIKYDHYSETVEEVFFAVLRKNFDTPDGYNAVCDWHIENIMSCRAREGELDDRIKELQTAMMSVQYDAGWVMRYHKTLLRLANPLPDGELAHLEHQRFFNKVVTIYGQYRHGVDFFTERNSDLVALPTGFLMAWSNGSDYVVTSTATHTLPWSETHWYEIKRTESIPASGVYDPRGTYDPLGDASPF